MLRQIVWHDEIRLCTCVRFEDTNVAGRRLEIPITDEELTNAMYPRQVIRYAYEMLVKRWNQSASEDKRIVAELTPAGWMVWFEGQEPDWWEEGFFNERSEGKDR